MLHYSPGSVVLEAALSVNKSSDIGFFHNLSHVSTRLQEAGVRRLPALTEFGDTVRAKESRDN